MPQSVVTHLKDVVTRRKKNLEIFKDLAVTADEKDIAEHEEFIERYFIHSKFPDKPIN